MHLYQDEDIDSIYTTSTLDELGLENNGVSYVIPEENIGEISNNEREKFDKLINKFSEIFATSDLDLGQAKGVTHKVDTADFDQYSNMHTEDHQQPTKSSKKKLISY